MEGRSSNETVTIQIFGPFLAWKAHYRGSDSVFREDHLQIQNWKTGRKVWVRNCNSSLTKSVQL